MVRTLTLLTVLLLPCLAHAGHGCNQFFQVKQVYQQAYVPVVPLIYSTISPGLADKAQILAMVREEIRQEQIRQQQQELQQRRPQQQLSMSILAQKCAKCHGKDKPAGGVYIDGQADVPDGVFRRWLEMAGVGQDVPEEMRSLVKSLTPEQNGQIMNEMLRLKPVKQVSQPAPTQAPWERQQPPSSRIPGTDLYGTPEPGPVPPPAPEGGELK